MFKFNPNKYRFFTSGKNEVIAVSTYAGKTVRGVAKVDPRDEFDMEKGKKLAVARCAEKIAIKRKQRANRKVKDIELAKARLEREYAKNVTYLKDAMMAEEEAHQQLKNVLAEM